MSAVETASMMSDVWLNISQLRIILEKMRRELDVKFVEPEYLMKNISGDILFPKFGEYIYYHEAISKTELIFILGL